MSGTSVKLGEWGRASNGADTMGAGSVTTVRKICTGVMKRTFFNQGATAWAGLERPINPGRWSAAFRRLSASAAT